MKLLVFLATSDTTDYRVNILVAIGAATFSTIGGFVVQFFLARMGRRDEINDKRLEALVQLREKVEYSGGAWFGWAAASHRPTEIDNIADKRRHAGDSLNDAWYAVTLFDLYFPTLRKETTKLRVRLKNAESIAHNQVANGVFDPNEFVTNREENGDLEMIVEEARKLLKLPKK